MNYPADLQEIDAHYPEARDQALAKLRASSSKKAAFLAPALAWSWSLGVVFSAQPLAAVLQGLAAGAGKASPKKNAPSALDESFRETDPQAYCDAHLLADFRLFLICENRYASDPVVSRAPKALVEAYQVKPYAPTPSKFTISVHQDRRGFGVAVFQEAIAGVYEKKGALVAVDHDGFLQELDPKTGLSHWGGGLRRSAKASFDACAPGGTFRYRNAPMRKLTDAETAALLSTHSVWSFGGMSPSVGGGHATPPLPPLADDTPVYGAGATDHPNAKPIGTAGSLGLLAPKTAVAAPAAKTAKPVKPRGGKP